MAGTYIPPAAAGIRYDSLLSPRIVGAAEVTGSLCGCPGNNAVQGRGRLSVTIRAGMGIFSVCRAWDRLFPGIPVP